MHTHNPKHFSYCQHSKITDYKKYLHFLSETQRKIIHYEKKSLYPTSKILSLSPKKDQGYSRTADFYNNTLDSKCCCYLFFLFLFLVIFLHVKQSLCLFFALFHFHSYHFLPVKDIFSHSSTTRDVPQ